MTIKGLIEEAEQREQKSGLDMVAALGYMSGLIDESHTHYSDAAFRPLTFTAIDVTNWVRFEENQKKEVFSVQSR